MRHARVRTPRRAASVRQLDPHQLPHHRQILRALHLDAHRRALGVALGFIDEFDDRFRQLRLARGGYGAREGKPAQGTLDTIYGKALLFDLDGQKSALITVDTCSVPLCVAEETLKKAGIEGLTLERLLICASHTHAGLEGYALDRRNVANNPNIGVFSEPVLSFVTDRLAKALREAKGAL